MILDISWWIPQVLPSNWNSPAQTSAVATAPLSERPGAAAQAAQTAQRAGQGASRSRWRPMSTTRRAATWSLLRYTYKSTFFEHLFPTCQVRVVRFYVSCLLLSSSPLLLLLLNRDPRRTVFSVGPQPRPSTPSVPCRTSTTTIPAQCSLPDLNHDHPRPVFPAGPQPRVSTPSVPCRTSTTKNLRRYTR